MAARLLGAGFVLSLLLLVSNRTFASDYPAIGDEQSTQPITFAQEKVQDNESDSEMMSARSSLLVAQQALIKHDTSGAIAGIRQAYVWLLKAKPIYRYSRATALHDCKDAYSLLKGVDPSANIRAAISVAHGISQINDALTPTLNTLQQTVRQGVPGSPAPGGFTPIFIPKQPIQRGAVTINIYNAAAFLRAARRYIHSARPSINMALSSLQQASACLNQTPPLDRTYWNPAVQDINKASQLLQTTGTDNTVPALAAIADAQHQLALATGTF